MPANKHAGSVIVRIEVRPAGHIAHVTVDNPGKRNALGIAGKQQLAQAFQRLAQDKLLRVAVLTGSGDRSFIAGADLAEMKDLTAKGAREEHTWTHRACEAIRTLPVPAIARINGYCFGAGMEIAASCDMRIGITTARFGMPEVRFGIPSGMEACLLPQLIGWGKTRELLYTGTTFGAAEALRIGFLQKTAPAPALREAARPWIEAILAADPAAIRAQKRLIETWIDSGVGAGILASIDAFSAIYQGNAPAERMRAFLERKRRK